MPTKIFYKKNKKETARRAFCPDDSLLFMTF